MSLNEYKKRLARLPSKPATAPAPQEEEKMPDHPRRAEWFEESWGVAPEMKRSESVEKTGAEARVKVKTLPAVPAYSGTAKVEEKQRTPALLSMKSFPIRKDDDSSK